MSKRKPMDKAEARERRNRMLESAATAKLSLTEGVREMRAIAGMTQEEFARHRGVSARVIKAIELGQGNPTVATMNRIGQFFGLEVAFVPIKRELKGDDRPQPDESRTNTKNDDAGYSDAVLKAMKARDEFADMIRMATEKAAEFDAELNTLIRKHKALEETAGSSLPPATVPEHAEAGAARGRTKRKPRST